MDPFSTSVYSSRRPFTIHCPAVSPLPELITSVVDSSKPLQPITPPSPPLQPTSRRRKPSITYHSPCSDHPVGYFIERHSAINISTTPSSSPHPTMSSGVPPNAYPSPPTSSASLRATSQSSFAKTINSRPMSNKPLSTTSIYALAPSLPLYHPLGKLALSLLPLPAATLPENRHPIDPLQPDIPHASSSRPRQPTTSSTRNRTSGRSRKVVAKLRDDETLTPVYTEDNEKERIVNPSPRKRKPAPTSPPEPGGGGCGGGMAKRKRNDAGGAPVSLNHPAKRLRISHTVAHGVSPSPSVAPGAQEDEMMVDKDDDPPSGTGKPTGRVKRPSRATAGGTRRSGGRRGNRKDKEKDKDSSLEDEELLASMAVPQAVTVPTKDENALSGAIPEEPDPHERGERTVSIKT